MAGLHMKDLFCRLALETAASPGSIRPQISKHQSEKTCLMQRLSQVPLIRNRQYNPGRNTCPSQAPTVAPGAARSRPPGWGGELHLSERNGPADGASPASPPTLAPSYRRPTAPAPSWGHEGPSPHRGAPLGEVLAPLPLLSPLGFSVPWSSPRSDLHAHPRLLSVPPLLPLRAVSLLHSIVESQKGLCLNLCLPVYSSVAHLAHQRGQVPRLSCVPWSLQGLHLPQRLVRAQQTFAE